MNILIITNMYPSASSPYFGLFVEAQYLAVSSQYPNYNIKVISTNGVKRARSYALKLLFESIKSFLLCKPDVVHVHYGLTAVIVSPLLLFAKLCGIKLVLTCHGSDVLGCSRFVTSSTKVVARLFDTVIAVSRQIEKTLSFLGNRVVWLPCGINDQFFLRHEPISQGDYIVFPSDPKRPEKNFSKFEEVLEKCNSQSTYRCLVGMSREEVTECLSRARCLVMTSKYEGSPQTVKESLALGTPVVSTIVGDVPEMLSSFEFSVVSNDINELSLAVDNIIVNGCREKINRGFWGRYSDSSVAEKVGHIYSDR